MPDLQFTIGDVNSIIRFPIVEDQMRRHQRVDRTHDIPRVFGYNAGGSTIYIDRDLKPWLYIGREVDTARFLLLRAKIEKSIIDAVATGGKDAQRLLILLRMADANDGLYQRARAVAQTAELYAVRLQHGAAGPRYYTEFLNTQCKPIARLAQIPDDLDMGAYYVDKSKGLAVVGGCNAD
jgi:hypothetical protein